MWALALSLILGLGLAALAEDPAPRTRYEIDASISEMRPRIDGTVVAWLTNTSDRPLDEAVFLLFPNRFARPDEEINDFTRPFVYPEEEFSPGSMRIVAVRDGEAAASNELLDPPGLPARSALRVSLDPVPPGATRRLTVRFRTEVPHRFGPFGEFEGQLTLVGGWYPYLAARGRDGAWQIDAPPPAADFDVSLHSSARQ